MTKIQIINESFKSCTLVFSPWDSWKEAVFEPASHSSLLHQKKDIWSWYQKNGQKIAAACSSLLGKNAEEKEEMRFFIETTYKIRNHIVHGLECVKNGDSVRRTSLFTISACFKGRGLLAKINRENAQTGSTITPRNKKEETAKEAKWRHRRRRWRRQFRTLLSGSSFQKWFISGRPDK